MIAPTGSGFDPNEAADALVVFGASGDLARKKLHPALFRLTAQGRLQVPILGVARSTWNDERFRSFAHDAVAEKLGSAAEPGGAAFGECLRYVSGDYADAATYERLRERLGPARRPAFYLAVPPSMFDRVISGLMGAGLQDGARVIVEKPFGRDLASAR